VVTLLLLAIAFSGFSGFQDARALLGLIPLLILGGAALFTIRGYTLSSDAIFVRRLLWETRLPLAQLQSARFEPRAMRWSLRLFGNGGVFSFSGLFRNKTLGLYRAFVTDLHRTVVLHFPKRTIVLSPSDPAEFVRQIDALSTPRKTA
jgi:hypothetical protein